MIFIVCANLNVLLEGPGTFFFANHIDDDAAAAAAAQITTLPTKHDVYKILIPKTSNHFVTKEHSQLTTKKNC